MKSPNDATHVFSGYDSNGYPVCFSKKVELDANIFTTAQGILDQARICKYPSVNLLTTFNEAPALYWNQDTDPYESQRVADITQLPVVEKRDGGRVVHPKSTVEHLTC